MGNKFIDIQTNNYIYHEQFTPFILFPKISEEISKDEEKSSKISKINRNKNDKESSIQEKIIEEKISLIIPKHPKNSFSKGPLEPNNIDNNDYFFNYIDFKGQKNIVNSYYSNLTYRIKHLKKNIDNLFIFDWDNTLFPTYFLAQENILYENEIPSEYLLLFSLLEDRLLKLLQFCINIGDTYIITNSSVGWVEHSINKYYPGLLKILNDIDIISAKNEYEHIYQNKKIWKEKAFLSLKDKINKNSITNIICFGDSYNDLEAGKKLASEIENCFIKTIKFKEKPEPEDLIKQINLILTKINYINSRLKNLCITIE